MSKITRIIVFLIVSTCAVQYMSGQDQIIDNMNQMPSFINPSYYGFKNSTKIGIASKFAGKTFKNTLEYRYAFGNTYFEDYNFSLGLDVYNSNLSNSGYNFTEINLSYIYQLRLYNEWNLYPAITVGYSF